MASEIIRLTTETELESLLTEIYVNTTSKTTKVTDHSVVRGLIRGNVKVGKKALKDIALAVSHLFPDTAYNATLDEVAENLGIAARFAAAQSSTYVRFVADPGTTYQQGIHIVSDNKGNAFDLEEDLVIGSKGFGYVKVRSQQAGSSTNVDPYTIINVNPEPSGHIGVINEYAATGGRDVESDDVFRQRIKEGPDILARGTLSYLTQAFIKINTNVLRVIYEGVSQSGKVRLGILTVNGIDLTEGELDVILDQASEYLSITELSPIGNKSYGVELKNVEYQYIDVDMRIELFDPGQFDVTVIDIQQKFSKLVDFRFWDSSLNKIEWEDLLFAVKNTSNVRYVPDEYFSPKSDIRLSPHVFPRFRGFIARDLAGNIILNQTGTINPVFYPNEIVQSLSETVI